MKNIKNKSKKIIICTIAVVIATFLYILQDGKTVSVFIVSALVYFFSSLFIINKTKEKFKINMKFRRNEEELKITLQVENTSKFPIVYAKILMNVRNIITGVEENIKIPFSIIPKRSKNFNFFIGDKRCGMLKVKVEKIIFSDILGLIKKEVMKEKEIESVIMPGFEELDIANDAADKYDMESFKYSQYNRGNDSSETFGIVPYKKGNDIKSIHWKLSAKTDEIMVREYGMPIDDKLIILIDKKIYDSFFLDADSRSYAAEFALSLSYTMAKRGITHYVGWFNTEIDSFEMFKTDETNDIWKWASLFLAAPFYTEGDSVVKQYIKADKIKKFAGFILVSDGETDAEELMEYGEVDIYRPQEFKKI